MKTFFQFVLLAVTFLSMEGDGKISRRLHKSLQDKGHIDILVSFENTRGTIAALSSQSLKRDHASRAFGVYVALKTHAEKSQRRALTVLQSQNSTSISFTSLWISNQISINGAGKSLLEILERLGEVKKIEEQKFVRLDDPIQRAVSFSVPDSWGIKKIITDEAWQLAGKGNGVVVGIIDSGARVTHEAIQHSYRGGTHSWYDPYDNTDLPNDADGHGTHVTGIVAGREGVGVAPNSNWISCKGFGLPLGNGTDAALLACAQFMACPHDSIGQNPDCNLAPHIVSNSWGGGQEDDFFNAAIDAWHASGIIPVFAAGNNGPTCGKVISPADSTSDVISVAATDSSDTIASFSSKGPTPHARDRVPYISAPGVYIVSAGIESDTSYITQSGTSMATPMVAGTIALLVSTKPDMTYATAKNALASSADTSLTFGVSECGGEKENKFPNYAFGYGRINAFKAVKSIFQSLKL